MGGVGRKPTRPTSTTRPDYATRTSVHDPETGTSRMPKPGISRSRSKVCEKTGGAQGRVGSARIRECSLAGAQGPPGSFRAPTASWRRCEGSLELVGAHGGFGGGAIAVALDHDLGGAPHVEIINHGDSAYCTRYVPPSPTTTNGTQNSMAAVFPPAAACVGTPPLEGWAKGGWSFANTP